MDLCTRAASILALAPLLALGGCHESCNGSSASVSAAALHGGGELWVLEVHESGEGGRDLNGDGDALDQVAFVEDLADGSLANLGLDLVPTASAPVRGSSAAFLAVGDVLVAIGVSEADQGNTDLNGDGDDSDTVLFVYDSRDRVRTNTALAVGAVRPAIGAGSVAFAVSEFDQDQQDLDGSGEPDGLVLHVYDARTRLTTNAGRNVTGELTFHDHAFAFTTDEFAAGTDLNGDGDEEDLYVFQLFDLVVGGIVGVPLAVRGRPLALGPDEWYLLVDEREQGADLNDDDDLDDGVYHAVEPHQGTIEPLGFSSAGSFGSLARDGRLALIVQEIDGIDRDGDTLLDDSYVALVEPGAARAFVAAPPVMPTTPLVLAGDALGFLVSETLDGERNGDGDGSDDVLHVLDALGGTVTDLGLDVLTLQGAGGRLLFLREEDGGDLVQEDWNEDGDSGDRVVFVLDASTGAVTHTRLASRGPVAAATGSALLLVGVEAAQGEDLDGDGDLQDDAWVLHALESATLLELGVAAGFSSAGLLEDGRGIVLVLEAGQGGDLNGDGDAQDLVLHTFRAP